MGTRRWVAIAGTAAAVAGVLATAGLVLPGVLAARLERTADACRRAIRATGRGDPFACPATVALRGLRAEDRRRAREVEWFATTDRLVLAAWVAAVRDLDPGGRDRALVDAARDVDAEHDVIDPLRAASQLGAVHAIVELAAMPAIARRDPARAALAGSRAALILGDRDALVEFARRLRDVGTDPRVRDDLACLAGLACPEPDVRTTRALAPIRTALEAGPAALVAALERDPGPLHARSHWTMIARDDAVDPAAIARLGEAIVAQLPAPVHARHGAADDPTATALLHGAWALIVTAAQLAALEGDPETAKRALWRFEELAGDLRFGSVDDSRHGRAPHDDLAGSRRATVADREPRSLAAARARAAPAPAGAAARGERALRRRPHRARLGAPVSAPHDVRRDDLDPHRRDAARAPPDRAARAGVARPRALRSDLVRRAAAITRRAGRAARRAGRRPRARALGLRRPDRDDPRLGHEVVSLVDDDGGLRGAGAAVALPEWLFVIGRLAGHGDPEPWLDTLFTDQPIRAWQHARELAARWRGDTRAADEWKRRREATETIVAAHPAVAVRLGI